MVAALLSLGGVHTARAEWLPNGNPMCVAGDCYGWGGQLLGNDAGHCFVGWATLTPDQSLALAKLNSSSAFEPGWEPRLTASTATNGFALMSDRLGGLYYVASALTGAPSYNLVAHHVSPDGADDPAWGDGKWVAPTSAYQYIAKLLAAPDGGLYVVWSDWRTGSREGDVYAQRLTDSGDPAPGWPADGLAVGGGPGEQGIAFIASDGSGGIVVGWPDATEDVNTNGVRLRVQRVSANAEPLWGPAGEGVLFATVRPSGWIEGIVPDGAGGYLIAFSVHEFRHNDLYLMRMQADGTRAPGWPETGRPIAVAPDEKLGVSVIGDGSGGMYLAWYDHRDVDTRGSDIYMHHLRPDGTPYPGWPENGLALDTSPYYEYGVTLAPDGRGGAYATWISELYNGTPVRAQHLRGNAEPAPGWPEGGIWLGTSAGWSCSVISDGVGGAYVGMQTNYFSVGRLVPDGPVAAELALVSADARVDAVALEWFSPDGAVRSATLERRELDTPWTELSQVQVDGAGHLRHVDRTVRAGGRYAYRLMVAGHASAETWVDVPTAARFALHGARPNPARAGDLRVAFALDSYAPATLALFDLNGRRVAAREVGALGAGSHTTRLSEGERLAPGLYWLRLSQGSRHASTRVVIGD